jgi:selenocysteine lyase/cysteine desulfurase
MRADVPTLEAELSQPSQDGYNLFAYPAQSNFSSVQHPLEWIEQAHAYGWDVLLDAAAYVPTNRLDLSKVKPDFVPVSFYKMFGYPTGSALIACAACWPHVPGSPAGRSRSPRCRAINTILPRGRLPSKMARWTT